MATTSISVGRSSKKRALEPKLEALLRTVVEQEKAVNEAVADAIPYEETAIDKAEQAQNSSSELKKAPPWPHPPEPRAKLSNVF